MSGIMIDCTGSNLNALMAALGSNDPDTFATYVTGSSGVPASSAQLSILANRAGLFKYDQSPALLSYGTGLADGADIENGAGTFADAITQTAKREAHHWYSWWYFSSGNLVEARQHVADNHFSRVRFVVANWDFTQGQAADFLETSPDVDAVQWASPTSNPHTICPGTSRTLSELNVDLNITRPGWFIRPVVPPNPVPKYKGLVITEGLTTMPVTSNDGHTWAG